MPPTSPSWNTAKEKEDAMGEPQDHPPEVLRLGATSGKTFTLLSEDKVEIKEIMILRVMIPKKGCLEPLHDKVIVFPPEKGEHGTPAILSGSLSV